MNEREYKIALSQAEGVGPKNHRTILDDLAARQIPLEDLFQGGEEILCSLPPLHNRDRAVRGIETIRETLDTVREMLEQLEEREVAIVLAEDEVYPSRLRASLGEQAPPVLYCYGNLELFGEPSGAVIGSRHPDEEALELAQRAARELVRAGRVVVSGCASGVDAAAHGEALDAGGNTIGVLSQGILATRTSEAFAGAADASSFLLVSHFPPRQTWNRGAAMSRNRTVCALADAVIVIQAGVRGGSRHAGATALEMAKPTFAIAPRKPARPGWEGNAALLQEGAIPLSVDEESGEVDFSPALDPPDPQTNENSAGQQTLF